MQLTQGEHGAISGVIDETELRDDGRLHSERTTIASGTVDGDQLTLTLHSNLFGSNIGGTVGWNTIKLQFVGRNGTAESVEYRTSSASTFKKYTEQLKDKADGVVLSANLGR
jgi:hypothetical protein